MCIRKQIINLIITLRCNFSVHLHDDVFLRFSRVFYLGSFDSKKKTVTNRKLKTI
jgi:hypothetical protein